MVDKTVSKQIISCCRRSQEGVWSNVVFTLCSRRMVTLILSKSHERKVQNEEPETGKPYWF